MKKRLRKKLRWGEFQELGFNLEFDYTGDPDGKVSDIFLTDFINAIEALGLEVGGGGYRHHDYFVAKHRGSVTEEQRGSVIDWLEKHPETANIAAGPLKDVWYGWDEK